MPRLLGTFRLNLTILATQGLVCSNCNSVVFNALETEFTEDSFEGITAQMLDLSGTNSVRIRGKNVKMACLSNLGDAFFDEIFPFLRWENDRFVVELKPQVKVRNYGGEDGYQIFKIDALKKVLLDSTKSKTKKDEYENLKSRLKTAQKGNNIAVFVGADSKDDDVQMSEAITLLQTYGIQYKERERKFLPVKQKEGQQFIVNMNYTVTQNICRFITKVAFNYFVYCALQSGRESVLLEPRFDNVKKFIMGDEKIDKGEIVVEVSDDPITYHEKESKLRFAAHTIVFFQEGGSLFSKITFLGGKVYKILLGESREDFLHDNFGCGHLFFPFDGSINNLTQLPKDNPTDDELKQSFGLFRRVDLTRT